jgi:hypothetical protein
MSDKTHSPHPLARRSKPPYYWGVYEGRYNEAQVERAWNELVTPFKSVAV